MLGCHDLCAQSVPVTTTTTFGWSLASTGALVAVGTRSGDAVFLYSVTLETGLTYEVCLRKRVCLCLGVRVLFACLVAAGIIHGFFRSNPQCSYAGDE